MTNQEVFDKVARHLLTQNRKAIQGTFDSCQYRTNDGLQCAAGCLIPEDRYDPKIEGKAVQSLGSYTPDVYNNPTKLLVQLGYKNNLKLIRSLQNVHDHEFPDNWKFELRYVAAEFYLTTEVLEEF